MPAFLLGNTYCYITVVLATEIVIVYVIANVRFADFNTGENIRWDSKRSRSCVGFVGEFCSPATVPPTAGTNDAPIGGFNACMNAIVAAPVRSTDDDSPDDGLSTFK